MRYIAKASGWIAGKRVTAGQPVDLTPEQAKYEHVGTPPEAVKPASQKSAVKRSRKAAQVQP